MARIETLERATIELLDGRLEPDLRREAEREAHKLAGSLTTFGFPEGSRLARDIDQTLQGGSSLEPRDSLQLSEKVLALRQTVEREATYSSDPTSDTPSSIPYHLLVIDDDPEVTDRLSADAPAKGLDPEFASSLASARQAISRRRPDAVLLNLSILGAKAECLALIEELSNGSPPTPVLVRTPLDDTLGRVQVARAGGRDFLPHALPPSQLLDAICGVLSQSRTLPAKVVAVDDDPQILALLEGLLNPAGAQITSVGNPLEFWNALEESAPDLVILDVDMPEASGIDLCKAIRSDPQWSGLPVMFLTSHRDPETVHQLFLAGGDDYIPKPLVGAEMVTRVLNRLERSRLLRNSGETDSLTGVSSRQRSALNQSQGGNYILQRWQR